MRRCPERRPWQRGSRGVGRPSAGRHVRRGPAAELPAAAVPGCATGCWPSSGPRSPTPTSDGPRRSIGCSRPRAGRPSRSSSRRSSPRSSRTRACSSGPHSGDMLLWDRERGHAPRRRRVRARRSRWSATRSPSAKGCRPRRSSPGTSSRPTTTLVRAPGARISTATTFGAVICAPLIFRGDAIGALNLHASRRRSALRARGTGAAHRLRGHAAIAIDHARRFESEVLLGRRLAETNQELTRSLAVQQRLADQVLADGGPSGIATVLARDLGRRVVIQDHIRRVIAGASAGLASAARRCGGRAGRGPGRRAVRRPGPRRARGRGPSPVSADQELGPIDRALVDIAVTGVALEFAKLRATVEVEERLRGETIDRSPRRHVLDEATIAARAARLGHDLGRAHDLFVIDALAGGRRVDAVRRGRRRRADDPLAVRASACRARAAQPRGGTRRLDRRARAAPASRGARARELWPRSCARRSRRPSRARSRSRSRVPAAGRRRSPPRTGRRGRAGAHASARSARHGRRRSRVSGRTGSCWRPSSLTELESFARSAVGPLLEHDRRHGADLTETLRVYLAEDRVQRRVAGGSRSTSTRSPTGSTGSSSSSGARCGMRARCST